ncbi:hypothetical protein [Streptomyces sp. NPDC058867]|uniref:hypothetical protein n=1 Tax=unclassified Streptomyces TaxID=2593676 RepID=UPI003694B377
MTSKPVTMIASINGRSVSREEVLAWESARFAPAARKLGLPVPSGDVARQRLTFADRKLDLGAAEIKRRLRRDLAPAAGTAWALARLSGGRRSFSLCDIHVSGGGAEQFAQWFSDTGRPDYVRSMIAANPDHFLIQTAPDGKQEVVETTGGMPTASRFLIDYLDTSSLVSRHNSAATVELAGVAVTDKGLPIGGVRHEFTDAADGFRAHLCVEFPRLTPSRMLREHSWHLAAEFSNWIEFAFGGLE